MSELGHEASTQFSGWAIVELFGRQREAGYVTTRYFGTACLLQIDIPEIPERDYILAKPEFVDLEWLPEGAKVRRRGLPARSRLVGPAAIYALNPCTEEAARAAIEASAARELVLLELPLGVKRLPEGRDAPLPDHCVDCGERNCICADAEGGVRDGE